MLEEQDVQALLEKVLGFSKATQTEALFFGTERSLTRFANNYIHQNVAETNTAVSVRAVLGNKIGVASTNKIDDEALRDVVNRALAIASVQPENPEFKSLPGPQPITPVNGYSEDTAACGPEQRAQGVKVIVDRAVARGYEAAGAFETAVQQVAVANSLGVFAHHVGTEAEAHAVVMADAGGSGFAQRASMNADAIDFEAMATEAVEKAARSRHPIELPVGEYRVVLDSYAVGEMLQYLAFMGLSALAVQEERSFMNGHFGEQLAAESMTIYDDAFDPEGLPIAFDFEGVPKQRVPLIERGIARAVVYDSFTANREGKPNTGHALPAPNTFGPYPANLMMAAGEASREDLFRGIERGVYVTRFHYCNIVHPVRTLFTGMTRDGTFLIEHGELTEPVKSLRFTQSILETLAAVEAIGKERLQVRDYTSVVVPAIRSGTFNFTGLTQ
ncbi:MAG TPA: TldD/PmbA family protein [Ktedonobacterales bacterium]|nr:TldD/PmbA family protein [Ktedonobacterales bacterium]